MHGQKKIQFNLMLVHYRNQFGFRHGGNKLYGASKPENKFGAVLLGGLFCESSRWVDLSRSGKYVLVNCCIFGEYSNSSRAIQRIFTLSAIQIPVP